MQSIEARIHLTDSPEPGDADAQPEKSVVDDATNQVSGWDAYEVWCRFIKEPRARRNCAAAREARPAPAPRPRQALRLVPSRD
jgi:hypothetical protein